MNDPNPPDAMAMFGVWGLPALGAWAVLMGAPVDIAAPVSLVLAVSVGVGCAILHPNREWA